MASSRRKPANLDPVDRFALTWDETPWNKGIPPPKVSRRARRAALTAQRAAYREALTHWALGVPVSEPSALRAIGLRAAHQRPATGRADVGGMDSALEAMEKAAQRELPAEGPFISAMTKQYMAGLKKWHDRQDKRRMAEQKTLKVKTNAELPQQGMKRSYWPDIPARQHALHVRLFAEAEAIIRRTWRSPSGRSAASYWHLFVAQEWDKGQCVRRYSPQTRNPRSRARGERASVYLDPNVLAYWKAGLANFGGPATLLIGIDRDDPDKCYVARQRGVMSFITETRPTPRLPTR